MRNHRLDPALASLARPVGRGQPFADDALQTVVLRDRIHLAGRIDERRRSLHALAAQRQALQDRATLGVGCRRQLLLINDQDVEDVQRGRRHPQKTRIRITYAHSLLKTCEVRRPFIVQNDELPVERDAPATEQLRQQSHFRECRGDVLAGATADLPAAAGHRDAGSHPVVLELRRPSRIRRHRPRCRQHGGDRRRQLRSVGHPVIVGRRSTEAQLNSENLDERKTCPVLTRILSKDASAVSGSYRRADGARSVDEPQTSTVRESAPRPCRHRSISPLGASARIRGAGSQSSRSAGRQSSP